MLRIIQHAYNQHISISLSGRCIHAGTSCKLSLECVYIGHDVYSSNIPPPPSLSPFAYPWVSVFFFPCYRNLGALEVLESVQSLLPYTPSWKVKYQVTCRIPARRVCHMCLYAYKYVCVTCTCMHTTCSPAWSTMLQLVLALSCQHFALGFPRKCPFCSVQCSNESNDIPHNVISVHLVYPLHCMYG